MYPDHGIYHYMAWGIQHGMKLYTDLVDMNWPGVVIIHLIARALSGPELDGLRFLDFLFQFVLCMTTTTILAKYGVKKYIRLFCVSAYILYYVNSGDLATSQREGFSVPLIVLGLYPWFTVNDIKNHSLIKWLVYGLITGFGLWIKPTPLLMVVTIVFLFFVVIGKSEKKIFFKLLGAYILGITVVSLCFILWMVFDGVFYYFLQWGIAYNITDYPSINHPWKVRYEHTLYHINSNSIPLKLLVAGFICSLMSKNWFKAFCRKEILYAVAFVISALVSILIQGKTHCLYHYVSFFWGIVFLSAILFSTSDLVNILYKYVSGLVFFCCIFLLYSTGLDFQNNILGPGCSTVTAREIKSKIYPNEQVVAFGSDTSTLLSELERQTPYPYIFSSPLYYGSRPGSLYRKIMQYKLDEGIKNPNVVFVILQEATLGGLLGDGYNIWHRLEYYGYREVYRPSCGESFVIYGRRFL